MTRYEDMQRELKATLRTWLVTGCAGFIGSNLLEALLKLDQTLVGLDNFSTGFQHNLDGVRALVTPAQWQRFRFIKGDIRDLDTCRQAVKGVRHVLHQAALGSVPRSIADPLTTHQSNVDGFLNLLLAARDEPVQSFTYASSSSVYGDHPDLPKFEDKVGTPLSPYAVTKKVDELYMDVFARSYGFKAIGLRYFNVFGPRQDPDGAYAAVIPKWIAALIKNQPVYVNGDGETSRDFCFVANAVQANLLAATVKDDAALNQAYNVAVGDRTTLNELYEHLRSNLAQQFAHLQGAKPQYRDFRPGDVRHSQADISKASRLLGYAPTHRVDEGLAQAMGWYVAHTQV